MLGVEVLGELKSEFPDLYFIIAGPEDNISFPEIKLLAGEYGVNDRVICTGLLNDNEIIPLFREADICIVPTMVEESFGMSALEALAAGVQLISSNRVPVAEWAKDYGAAISIPPTKEKFCSAVRSVILNREETKRMSYLGTQFAIDKFDSSKVAQQMAAQLDSIISTGYPITKIK